MCWLVEDCVWMIDASDIPQLWWFKLFDFDGPILWWDLAPCITVSYTINKLLILLGSMVWIAHFRIWNTSFQKGKFSFQNALHSQCVPHITTIHVAHINHVSDKNGWRSLLKVLGLHGYTLQSFSYIMLWSILSEFS